MPNNECQWDPMLHHGRPCPFHSGKDNEEFDSDSSEGLVYSNILQKNIRIKKEDVDLNQVQKCLDESLSKVHPETLDLMKKYVTSFNIIPDEDEKGKTRTSHFDPNTGEINFVESAFYTYDKDSSRFTGGTIFHESGHQISARVAQKLYNLDYYDYTLKQCATACYKSEYNGKTLQQTLKDEFRKMRESDIIEIVDEMQDYYKEYLINARIDVEDYKDYVQKLRKNYSDTEKRLFLKNEFKNKYSHMLSTIEYNALSQFQKDYYVVSDVISSRWYPSKEYGSKAGGILVKGKDFSFNFGSFGHSETYYNSGDLKFTGLGDEFFANVFAAQSCNLKRTVDTARAYFPESMKVYDELIQKIKELK